jgi:hypothetical protein
MKTTKTKILAGAALTAVTTAASLAGITAQSGAVSMGWSGQAAMIAAVGPSNSLDVYSQQLGATTFTKQVVAGPSTTFSSPSFAQVGNLSLIAVQGPNNHLVVYAQTSGSPTWTPEVVPGAATFGKQQPGLLHPAVRCHHLDPPGRRRREHDVLGPVDRPGR